MASIHATAEGLHASGVMDKRTMREFDDLCRTPIEPMQPNKIRALRLRKGTSEIEKAAQSSGGCSAGNPAFLRLQPKLKPRKQEKHEREVERSLPGQGRQWAHTINMGLMNEIFRNSMLDGVRRQAAFPSSSN